MQRVTAQRLPIATLLLVTGWSCSALSSDFALQHGSLDEGIYVSASQKIRCDLSDFLASASAINESYDPGESETINFGVDKSTHFDIWTIRRQLVNRLQYLPGSTDGFPINEDTFTPYYYSELPYAIRSVANADWQEGRMEILEVILEDEQSQLHAYWLDTDQDWMFSTQFTPTLVEEGDNALDPQAVEHTLRAVRERCQFR